MIRAKVLLLITVFLAALSCFSQEVLPEVETPVYVYESKSSGDEAFRAERYGVAASFYTRYREEAVKRHDMEAVRDSRERELDALVRGRFSSQAEQLLSEYVKMYPDRKLPALIWRCDLLLLQKKASEAERQLVRAIAETPEGDPLRNNLRSRLALAYELQGKYKQSADVYSDIYSSSSDSPSGLRAAERMILCLGADGDFARGLNVLSGLPEAVTVRDKSFRGLLGLYLKLKSPDGGADFESGLKSIEFPQPLPLDPLFYTLFSLTGDELAVRGRSESALSLYRRAYETSGDKNEALESLARMVAMLEKLKRNDEAAKLALNVYELFKGAMSSNPIRMRLGAVLCKGGKSSEAFEVYKSALESLTASGKEREKIYSDALSTLLQYSYIAEARNLHSFYFKDRSSMDSLYSGGVISEKAGLFSEAGQSFFASANKADSKSPHRLLYLERACVNYFKAKSYADVIKVCGEILEIDPENHLINLRAKSHEELGDNKLARQDYIQYASLGNVGAEFKAQAFFRTASLALADGKNIDALHYFERVFNEYPQTAYAAASGYEMTILLSSDTSKQEKTVEIMKSLYRDSDYTACALLELADNHTSRANGAKALSALLEIEKLSVSPSLRAGALYRRSLLLYREKKYAEALALTDEIEKKYSSESLATESLYLRGDIQKAQNNYREAISEYSKAAVRRPGSALSYAAAGAKGDCYFALATPVGDRALYELALKEYSSIPDSTEKVDDEIRSCHALALYKTGRIHQFLLDEGKARNSFEKLIYISSPNALEFFWIQKGVAALEQMALKNPLPENTIPAEKALEHLKFEYIKRDDEQMAKAMPERILAIRRKINESLPSSGK